MGSSGSCSVTQSGHLGARAQGQADLAGVTVAEPAQGRGDVGVLGGERGVLRLGRAPRRRSRRTRCRGAGACRRRPSRRGRAGSGRAMRMKSGYSCSAGQSMPSALRGAVQASYVARVRRRQGAQEPDPGVDHERGGGEAGEQRDLRVPLLDRQERAELQAPVVAVDLDLLLGQRQRHPAARGLAVQAQLADLLQQAQRLAGACRRRSALRRVVVELGASTAPGRAPP